MNIQDNTQVKFEEDEMSLKDLVAKVRKWARFFISKIHIILTVAFVGGSVGFLSSYFKNPVYTGELTFVLENGSSGVQAGGYAGLASQFGLDMGGGGQGVFEGENLLALMKSRLMTEKALLNVVEVNKEKITMIEFYIRVYKIREKWISKKSIYKDVTFPPGSIPSNFSVLQNTIISNTHHALITENVFVDKKDKKSGIISLRVESENELFSKLFSEILAKEVSQFYVETKTKKSSYNVQILQHQTDSIRREMSRSMAGAAASMDANPNQNLAMQILRVPAKRREGDAQVNQAILSQLVQNLEVAKMSLRTETPLIQIIDRPVLPLKKSSPDIFASFIKWSIVSGILVSIFLFVRHILNAL